MTLHLVREDSPSISVPPMVHSLAMAQPGNVSPQSKGTALERYQSKQTMRHGDLKLSGKQGLRTLHQETDAKPYLDPVREDDRTPSVARAPTDLSYDCLYLSQRKEVENS